MRYVLRWRAGQALSLEHDQDTVREVALDGGAHVRWLSYVPPSGVIHPDPARNRDNGLLVVQHSDGRIAVSTDHFGSLPAFYGQAADNTVIVSNVYDEVASRLAPCSVDPIGFWEMALFETPLCGRTALKEVSILDAATTLTLHPDGRITLRPYWRFTIEPVTVTNDRDLAHQSLAVLQAAFDPARQQRLLFPVGGGVDCRLSAAALSRMVSAEQVHGVTYGYSPLIFEYRYAKETFARLGLPKPEFHRLTEHSYLKHTDYLSRRNGALVGLGNTHLLDYLSGRNAEDLDGRVLISNMYSDAVCGWAAKDTIPDGEHWDELEHVQVLDHFDARYGLPVDVVEGIRADLATLRDAWRDSSFSTLDEYIYVHERNAKFHLVMSDMWRPYLPVYLPFAQWDVARHFFGIPNRYRQDKKITYLVLETCFPELAGLRNVSSAFRIQGLGNPLRTAEYRGIAILNGLLRRRLGVPIHIVNRYETENRNFYLRFAWQKQLAEALGGLHDRGVIDDRLLRSLMNERRRLSEPVACQLMSNLATLSLYTA